MGVDFKVYRIQRRGIPPSDVVLPEMDTRFAFTEYPRFLTKLAEEAGLQKQWSRYRQAVGELMDAAAARGAAQHASRHESRQQRKQRKKKGPPASQRPVADKERAEQLDRLVISLTRKVETIRDEIRQLADREPLVEFLCDGDEDETVVADKVCRKVAPRLRAIAETWEPAPEGYVGWREKALDIAEGMEFAGKYPDVVFAIFD